LVCCDGRFWLIEFNESHGTRKEERVAIIAGAINGCDCFRILAVGEKRWIVPPKLSRCCQVEGRRAHQCGIHCSRKSCAVDLDFVDRRVSGLERDIWEENHAQRTAYQYEQQSFVLALIHIKTCMYLCDPHNLRESRCIALVLPPLPNNINNTPAIFVDRPNARKVCAEIPGTVHANAHRKTSRTEDVNSARQNMVICDARLSTKIPRSGFVKMSFLEIGSGKELL